MADQEISAEMRAQLEEAARAVNKAVPIPEGEQKGEVAKEKLTKTDEEIRKALAALQEKVQKVAEDEES